MIRCWIRRPEEGIHVVAWYLLDDGSWLHVSALYGVKHDTQRSAGYHVALLKDLMTLPEWEEVPFASLQLSDRMTP